MAATQARFPDLEGAGVIVTGGSTGIGAALVEAFALQGAKVGFLDIAAAEGLALVERLSAGVAHSPVFEAVDLRDIAATRQSMERLAAALGSIRVLVNNAAWDDRHDIDTVTEDYWDDNQAINLKPVFFLSQAVVPHLRRAGGGAIVNFSSIAFLLNMADVPAYAAAKAGIIGLTKSLAGRLGPDNIRVNAILPGMIVTERQKKLWLTEEGIETMVARQCLKRPLVAEDMVGPCLFLSSACSGAMTAQTIIADGGLL
ncbi:3-oxoacyl-ACP reductase [Metarhizobium album]|uniref:3-oxoacyl-ACP reductase n=1 Tax=Metarhizobium album TaxID=2182425 RepID=A0A2U2DXD1_9HYPH|nr:SDR family oxidoreductase [Rhizobium album]PWE57985.1 3-oxoacyl-ACP reductase [Rhizobium album]